MLTFLHFLTIAVFMAFCYRCRGGFLGTGSTQAARILFWALPVMIIILPLGFNYAFYTALMAFLGLMIPHGKFQNDTSLHDIFGMSLIGAARLALILTPLSFINYYVLFYSLLGLGSGLAYYIGHRFLDGVDSGIETDGVFLREIQLFDAGKFAVGATEWGEVGTGLFFGLGLGCATWLLN